MNIYILLSALAIIFFPSLGFYVYGKNTKDPLYVVFTLFCLLSGYLAFCELHIRITGSAEAAGVWLKLRFLRFFLIPLLFHFFILFTGLKPFNLTNKLLHTALYLPAALLSLYDLLINEYLQPVSRTPRDYGILQLPQLTPFFILYATWVLGLTLATGALSLGHYKKNPSSRVLFTSMLLALGIPVLGKTLEALFSLIQPQTLPPLYSLLASWIALFFFLGLRKHKFLLLTPYQMINTVIDMMAEAFLLLSAKGRIVNLNKACLELLGYTREELEGHSFAVFRLNKKELSYIEEKISKGKGIKNREMRIKTKKGRDIYVSFSCSLLYSQKNFATPADSISSIYNLSGFVCLFNDLTAKKEIEKDLKQQRDWLKIILASIGDGIMATDRQGKITFMNKEAERITEWSLDEAYGNDINLIFRVINKGAREEAIDPVIRMLQQGTFNSPTHDILLITKSGRRIPIDNKFAPLQDEQNKLWGVILIFRDVSEIEDSRQELKAAQAQLIRSEKLAGLGRLAAGVAHEINNPLGYITSNLRTLTKYVAALKEAYKQYQQLLGKIGPLPSEVQREFDKKLVLDFIIEDIDEIVRENKEGIDKIVQIVSDLKSFTHTNPEADFKPADINQAVKNTITVTRNECKYVADVKCELAKLLEIECNVSEIKQVLLNIIVNAVQAIKSQKRKDKGRIQISTYEESDTISCEITDDGPGILPENLNRIFEPFFTTKPPGVGTGLGLSISYDIIVNRHRGEFLVESDSGGGARFIIRLPKTQN